MKSLTFKQRVKQGVNDLFYIWKQEFRNTFRDQGMLIFFVLVPLVYPLIYSFIYTNETLRDVPAVVVDNSRTALSRDYLRRVDATPEVSIVSHCADMEEAKLALRERKAYGIIYLPASFSDDIAQGRQTQVSLYCDMSGLLYYKSMLLANTEVSLDMNAEIKIARAGNTTERQDELTAYPIVYQDVALYNPTNGFAAFLIPAVLMLIIQQTLLLGIGLSAGTAREHNRFRDLVPVQRHYNGTLRIVLGKGLPDALCPGGSLHLNCGSPLVSPESDCFAGRTDSFLPALPAGMYLFQHDSIHCYPQPRDLHVVVCFHFRTVAVPFRHIVAGQCDTAVLERVLLFVPFHLRNQRLCAHQQHGSHPERSCFRIPCFVVADRYLFPDDLPGIPLANHTEQETRHREIQTA